MKDVVIGHQRQYPLPVEPHAPARRGLQPAFLDQMSGRVYVSVTTDGAPAPIHLPDCLPDHLVQSWDHGGRVMSVRPRVVHGYVCGGRFYDRDAAQRLLEVVFSAGCAAPRA